MKILYAIQGTGNGHLSRAQDIVPMLQASGEVDILVSGIQADIELPYPVKYQLAGMSFIFGKKGGVDIWATLRRSSPIQFIKDILALPVHEYDLIINDFEPVSAWACWLRNKCCIGLSHQAAVLHAGSPKANHTDPIGRLLLAKYAPVRASYGFHFARFADTIFTPVIRSQIRALKPQNLGHYTVYLPAYEDKRIINILKKIPNVSWHVFSKHTTQYYQNGNIRISPISNQHFIESMAGCEGMLCGAGFESPAEALFLGKKLLVVPMKRQFEQHCNAAALSAMGIDVIKSLKKKHLTKIKNWIEQDKHIHVNYPDNTCAVLDMIIERHAQVSVSAQQGVVVGAASQ